MPSVFAHAVSAGALSYAFGPKTKKGFFKLFILAVICASIPDLDVIAFKFGIPYSHWLGHRGFAHSFVFAFLWSFFIVFAFYNKQENDTKLKFRLWLFFGFITASHGIFDAMTSGGLGIAFFSPFSNERFFFPWRPILVSPIGIEKFFSDWGLKVLISEFRYIGIPSICLIIITCLVKNHKFKGA